MMPFLTVSSLKVSLSASLVIEHELIWHTDDDLCHLVDSENGDRQKFSAGGPFLPRPPAPEAPLVIIPSIRFSAGVDFAKNFKNKMVDQGVEAASFLITSVLERPALIYPWIRICSGSKA